MCMYCDTSNALLWSPLSNRADHYIFALWFLLSSSFFFPHLISAVADWMSAILPQMVCLSASLGYRSETCEFRMHVWNLLHAARWKYRTQKSRQKSPSGHHRTTLSRYTFPLWHISTIGKKLVKQVKLVNLLHRSSQYGELRPTNGWDRLTSLGHPCKFQLVLRLGSVTARHLVVGVSQTLRRWTEGVTYIRQGDHHVGHWPTFLVVITYFYVVTVTQFNDNLFTEMMAYSKEIETRMWVISL